MPSTLNSNNPNLSLHERLFKWCLAPVKGAIAVINTFLLCFYPGVYSAIHQSKTYLKTIPTAGIISSRRISRTPVKRLGLGITSILPVMLLSVSILSCNSHNSVGIKKDFNTGLKTEYKNIEPEETVLVMNDEVLGHNDIPLGEQFTIINKGVKGLTEKDGKVSLGCSLLITDMKGGVILNEPDLFKENGTVDAEQSEYLKCIVSTGQPMEWDEQYKVKAGFWDKWGDGKIVNEVTIKMIDIP
jgi:hypothetical protein